jgi:HJR/Mrr/RecB family endonuclease
MTKWAFIILLVSIFSFYITKIAINEYKKQKKRAYYLNSRISQIDQMSGEEFEELLRAHFEKQGYQVNLTQKTNDYGADLILQKNGVKTIVQAKRHKQKIGNRAVQEIVAAKGHYKAAHGMVISNSYYSANCVKLAFENDIVLWSRNDLIEKFKIK